MRPIEFYEAVDFSIALHVHSYRSFSFNLIRREFLTLYGKAPNVELSPDNFEDFNLQDLHHLFYLINLNETRERTYNC